MNKKTTAICGILIFCIGVGLGFHLSNLQKIAIGKDFHFFVPATGGGCRNSISSVDVSRRTMTENESQAVTVILSNHWDMDCAETITINAPNFDISPYEQEKSITIPKGESHSEIWILTPRRVGAFEIAVGIESSGESQTVGINVTNLLGLTAGQAQMISYIGSFLGPILTAPWWLELLKKSKSKNKKKPQ